MIFAYWDFHSVWFSLTDISFTYCNFFCLMGILPLGMIFAWHNFHLVKFSVGGIHKWRQIFPFMNVDIDQAFIKGFTDPWSDVIYGWPQILLFSFRTELLFLNSIWSSVNCCLSAMECCITFNKAIFRATEVIFSYTYICCSFFKTSVRPFTRPVSTG